MAITKKPFLADSLVFKGAASASSTGDIKDIEAGIIIDDKANIGFRDNYVKNILNKDYITIKEMYTRIKGIFTDLDSNGNSKLYFKDDSVSRAYSLSEIVNACTAWRSGRTNGSLWWVGRHEIDHSQCANLPRSNDRGGPKVLWSIDRFLSEINNLSVCESVNPIDYDSLITDPRTGSPRWWDVQNLEIVLPPSDSSKAVILMAKLAYICNNSPEPILFRLYDATAGVELTRNSVLNDNSGNILYPVPLSYFGPLPTINTRDRFSGINGQYSSSEIPDCQEDCGCTDISCVDGDPYCRTSSGENVATLYGEGAHLIKVQFRVINYHQNHWERVFGVEIPEDGFLGTPEYISTSSIDAIVFDTSKDGKFTRQQGSARFQRETEYQVTFEKPIDTTYSISLSCGQNVNVWFTNKLSTGFVIKSELPFSGYVDWSIIAGE